MSVDQSLPIFTRATLYASVAIGPDSYMALYVCLSVLLCLCHKSVLRRNEWADIDLVYGMEASFDHCYTMFYGKVSTQIRILSSGTSF